MGNVQNRMIHRHREWFLVVRGLGGGGVTADGDGAFFWSERMFWN